MTPFRLVYRPNVRTASEATTSVPTEAAHLEQLNELFKSSGGIY